MIVQEANMTSIYDIAGYVRISVDDEQSKDNVSIENQKAIIADYVKTKFPGSSLTFYEDRDRSGYTFEQREGYQAMRKGLVDQTYHILIVKDFSRFSRRNSRGLVELEELRDAGVRIISIGDGIDFPNDDDWLKIQFQFLINEMPVTDTSKKVKNVIRRRQLDGEWICAAPYGYIINDCNEFEIVPTEADIVRKIFHLYNVEGWGYKKIANQLTEQGIPTPRMCEQMRKEAKNKPYNRKVNAAWAIVTVQGILDAEERFVRMQNHSGEHILCGIAHAKWGAENVGFHLGDREMTMDLDIPLTEEQLEELELAGNRAVWANTAITAAYPDKEVVFYDERFTSVLAHRAMIDGGMKKMARRDKAVVDKIAATIILEDYLQYRQ